MNLPKMRDRALQNEKIKIVVNAWDLNEATDAWNVNEATDAWDLNEATDAWNVNEATDACCKHVFFLNKCTLVCSLSLNGSRNQTF